MVVLLCGVGLLAAACSNDGLVGVRKTADGFEVLSRCDDVGIAGFAVGQDTGSRQSQGVYPVLEVVGLDVQLVDGVDGPDAPFAVTANDPGELYEVTGSIFDLDLGSPLVVDAEVAVGFAITAAMVVDLSEMQVGDIAVPDHSLEATQRQIVVASEEFEDGRERCKEWSAPSWVVIPAGVVFWAAIASGIVSGIRAIWRRMQRRRTYGHLPPPPA